MSDDKAFHCKLDGKGYVLVDESYSVQPQRPFNPRFSSGDPGFGDLSFWQFLSQESFTGGEGQEIFATVNEYMKSSGWEFKSGKPRLSYGFDKLTVANALPAKTAGAYITVQTLIYSNNVYVIYPTAASAAFTITQILARSVTDGVPNIYHINAYHGAIYRGGAGAVTVQNNDHLMVVHGLVLRALDANHGVAADTALTHYGMALSVVETNKVIVAGMQATGGGTFDNANPRPTITRVRFGGNDFTVGDYDDHILDGFTGTTAQFLNCSAQDSNGTIYFALVDYPANMTAANSGAGRNHAIVRMTAADATAADNSSHVSTVDNVQNMRISYLAAVNGTVYIFGWIPETGDTGRRAIWTFPSTLVWSSTKRKTLSGSDFSAYYNTAFPSLDSIICLGENDDNTYLPILNIGVSGAIEETASIDLRHTQSATVDTHALGIAQFSGHYYVMDAANNFLYRSNRTRRTLAMTGMGGTSLAAPAYKALTLSRLGGNTPLINKSLYKVILEISEALPTGGALLVYVNGIAVGQMDADDGLRLELSVASELTAADFKVALLAPSNMQWNGAVDRIAVQYIPTQLKKLAWGFAIRAIKGLRLLNGQFEQRTPAEIVADIKAAWAKNVPLEYVDVDGETYSVILTEFKGRQPLHADKRSDREFMVPIEILEV